MLSPFVLICTGLGLAGVYVAWHQKWPAKELHIKIWQNRLVLLDTGSGRTVEVLAELPFSTSRMLIGDFGHAVAALDRGTKQLYPSVMVLRPRVIVRPQEFTEGGLCQVEERVFREFGLEVGRDVEVRWRDPHA